MSEYTPITGELRAAMRQWGRVESDGSITFTSSSMPPSIDAEQSLAIIGSDFDRLCDAIDSINAQLERENEDLRTKFVSVNRYAEHVERENESLKAELDRVLGEQDRDGWIELPKDADGKHIRIGDVMEWYDGETFEVVGIGDGVLFYIKDGHEQADWTYASTKRHYTPDTWERIIYDALQVGRTDITVDVSPLIARCRALCERTKGGDAE